MNVTLLAMISLAATLGTVGLDASEDDSAPKPQSPAELLAKSDDLNFGETIATRFRVGSVNSMPVTGPNDESYSVTQLHPASDADIASRQRFHVEIGPDAAAALKRVGITDLRKHFVGKTIEVRGT